MLAGILRFIVGVFILIIGLKLLFSTIGVLFKIAVIIIAALLVIGLFKMPTQHDDDPDRRY